MPDDIDPPDPSEAHRLLTQQVAELRQELAAARTAEGTTTAQLTELRGQLADAQRELERLRVPPTPAAKSSDFLDDVFSQE